MQAFPATAAVVQEETWPSADPISDICFEYLITYRSVRDSIVDTAAVDTFTSLNKALSVTQCWLWHQLVQYGSDGCSHFPQETTMHAADFIISDLAAAQRLSSNNAE